MREALETALVRIRTKDGEVVGSGFLVGEREVLTCAHVITQALGFADDPGDPLSSQVHLDFPQLASHTLLLARVVFWLPVQSDSQGDIAGLELLDEPPAGAKAVQLTAADQVWGHPFRALGFPHGYDDGVWATGRLLGRQGTRLIQLEDIKIPGFPVMSGFSGAPVWDEQLQGVTGMIALASQAATTKTAFAIPSDVLVSSWPQLATFLLPSVPRNPYKGLDAFTQDDTRDFFGREALVKELVTVVEETLTHEQKGEGSVRLLAVLGASGSGKSSVVMAGLVPHLQAGGVPDSQNWVYLDPIVPGTDPLEAVLIALKPHFPDTSFHTLRQDLEENVPRGLHLLATQLVDKPGERALLLIDQFEEVFTLTTDEAKRRRFFDLLVTAVTEPHGPLFIILTLRADLYDRPMQYPELYRLMDEHHVSVLPMGRDELRSAIEGPAHLPEVHLTFEGGLIEEVLFAVEGQSGALPLLEFTLDQLVRRRDGQQLTRHAYQEMGEVKGALSQYAEEVYQELPSNEHREAARDLFLRLIHLGITEQDITRRRARYAEFEQADSMQTQRLQEVLERFIRARLLTGSQVSGIRTIEVSHEALIREWKRLAAWLREARADILFQQSLSEDVAEWEQRERPGDRLYRGAQLKEAKSWARRNRPSKQEAAFLQGSVHQRTLSLVRWVAVALLLVSSIGGAWWFFAPPDPTLVTTLQDNVKGSLRYCIENASSGSTIRFAPHLHGTIYLRESLTFPGSKYLTIQGLGSDKITISGGKNSYANIQVLIDATINISGLSFEDSEMRSNTFLFNEGNLTITNSVIANNKTTGFATDFGGGIENGVTGILAVTNTTISNNSSIGGALSEGGGIYNEGKLIVTRSKFLSNTANSSIGEGWGGGIYNGNTGTIRILSSTFSVNKPTNSKTSIPSDASATYTYFNGGGAIYNDGKLTVSSSNFSKNTASSNGSRAGYGGGIGNSLKAAILVSNSTFSDNSATSNGQTAQGGGINNDGSLTVQGSRFLNNTASSSGGKGYGGGINNFHTGVVTVTNSTFSDNTANGQYSEGGGIDNDDKITVTNSTFSKNSASSSSGSSYGGGIQIYHTSSSQTILSNSIIAANTASNGPDVWGVLTSGSHNLLTNIIGVTGLDATNQQIAFADLKLNSTLYDNGGPTQTLALLPESPAIDAVPLRACHATFTDAFGQTETITTDQRGDPRPDGSENACDIGAYESSY